MRRRRDVVVVVVEVVDKARQTNWEKASGFNLMRTRSVFWYFGIS
jgi:hypothetical protein